MLKPLQFIKNLLNEAGGNEKYGSLIKLILPMKAYLNSGSEVICLETAIDMKENCYFLKYYDENRNLNYALFVYRNEFGIVTGFDISLIDNDNRLITYYSSTKINEPKNKRFRFTRIGYDKMYTISFKLIEGTNENRKFLCDEKYYDQKSTNAIADLYSESELLDLADDCSLEPEGQNIFTLEPDLKTVIDYFECITMNFSDNDFWEKRLVN